MRLPSGGFLFEQKAKRSPRRIEIDHSDDVQAVGIEALILRLKKESPTAVFAQFLKIPVEVAERIDHLHRVEGRSARDIARMLRRGEI